MNAEKISDREEVLKIVNEDWPMLEELGKKRFVINKKQKPKDVQESLQALHTVLKEEEELLEEEVKTTPIQVAVSPKEVVKETVKKVEQVVIQEEMIKEVKDETIVVAKEVASSSQTKTQNATTIAQSSPIENTKTVNKPVTKVIQKVKDDEIVEENSIDLIKLIVAGLTHLYLSKTSKLLKPLQFVLQHKKEVSIAMMHFVVPLLMTYFMTTHVGFVAEQLLKETFFMKSVYLGIFFFGSTFVWITSQVLLSGILSMLTKSMLEVAKVGKQNK